MYPWTFDIARRFAEKPENLGSYSVASADVAGSSLGSRYSFQRSHGAVVLLPANHSSTYLIKQGNHMPVPFIKSGSRT